LTSPEFLALAPNEAPEVVLLPASNWNRAALRVPVQIKANGAIIDVWCASVRAANSEAFLPNGGPYYGLKADGTPNLAGVGTGAVCNAAEQNLQISRLIAAVNARAAAANRRAVVGVLTYASPEIGDPSAPIITSANPQNFALFAQPPWQELTSPGYTPKCTYCGDNPLNGTGDAQWTQHIFGIGLGRDDVDDDSTIITFKDSIVSLTLYGSTNPILVPVSEYYGFQSTVRVTK